MRRIRAEALSVAVLIASASGGGSPEADARGWSVCHPFAVGCISWNQWNHAASNGVAQNDPMNSWALGSGSIGGNLCPDGRSWSC